MSRHRRKRVRRRRIAAKKRFAYYLFTGVSVSTIKIQK